MELIEKMIAIIRLHISKQMMAAFLSCAALGFITHNVAMSDLIMNWDSMKITLGTDWAIAQGKWLYPALEYVRGPIDMGPITVPLAVLLCALSAAIVVGLFNMRNNVLAVLVGAVFAVFPSMLVICAYNSEDIFLFAVLLSILSVYAVRRLKFGYLIGTILLTFSLGIYQAYIGFAAGLLIVICITELFGGMRAKQVLFQGLKYCVFLIASIALYYLILQLVIMLSGVEIGAYRDMSSVLSGEKLTFSNIVGNALLAYSNFVSEIIFDSFGAGTVRYRISFLFVSVAILLLFCALLWRNRQALKPQSVFLQILLFALLPLGINIVEVLSFGATEYWIMMFPFAVWFLLPLIFADCLIGAENGIADTSQTEMRGKSAFIFAQLFAVFAIVVLVFNWYILDTQGYSRLQVSYEGAYANAQGMVDDITSVEGYSKDSKIAVIGTGEGLPGSGRVDRFKELNSILGVPARGFPFGKTERWSTFVSLYLGYDFNMATADEMAAIKATDEFRQMACFPYDNSTRVINGIIVLRLF